MQILEASPSHAKDILDIRRIVRADTYADGAVGASHEYLLAYNEITPERIAAERAEIESSNSGYWIAKKESVIMGYVKTRGLPRQAIDMLHILEAYRERGIGSALLQNALESLDRSESIYLEVVHGNTQAFQWWRKKGWQPTGKVLEGTQLPNGQYMLEDEMTLNPKQPPEL
jgi:ribosomal protein S18 acetylase RimI-like enzyme